MKSTQIRELLLPEARLNEAKGGVCYFGKYRGYHIILEAGTGIQGHPAGTFVVTINATAEDEQSAAELDRFLGELPLTRKKLSAARRANHSIQLVILAGMKKKDIETIVNPVVEEVVRYLELHYISGGCQSCGRQDATLDCYTVETDHHYLCPECAEKVEQGLKEKQSQVQAKKSNLLPGIVGALLGGLIGVAVWIGFDQLNIMTALSGVVMAVAACKGYELLGKAMDKKGAIVCIAIVLILPYFANKLCWTIALYRAPGEYWPFSYCYQMLREVLEYNDSMGRYIGNLLLGYLFTALGAAGILAGAFVNSTGAYTFHKNLNLPYN